MSQRLNELLSPSPINQFLLLCTACPNIRYSYRPSRHPPLLQALRAGGTLRPGHDPEFTSRFLQGLALLPWVLLHPVRAHWFSGYIDIHGCCFPLRIRIPLCVRAVLPLPFQCKKKKIGPVKNLSILLHNGPNIINLRNIK